MNYPILRFNEFNETWVPRKIGDDYKLISGQHLLPNDYVLNKIGVGYFTGPSDFTNNEIDIKKWTTYTKNTAFKGDILITVKGSGVGSLWFLRISEVALGRQLMAIRPKGSSSSFFLFTYLLKKTQYFQSLGAGNMIPGVSRDDMVAVEMAVTSHPPHRSVRAELPHTAPAKSIGLKSLFRVRMQHFKWRQKAIG